MTLETSRLQKSNTYKARSKRREQLPAPYKQTEQLRAELSSQ